MVAVGTRMPGWVVAGVKDYTSRFPREWRFELMEIPVAARGKNAVVTRQRDAEGRAMLKGIPDSATVIALDLRGEHLNTADWAQALQNWQRDGRTVCLLIGGPDGLAPAGLQRAQYRWSLSALTLPHALVRVLVAEQLYRAWSLSVGHPYHRA